MKKFFVWLFILSVTALAGCCIHRPGRVPSTESSFVNQLQDSTIAIVQADEKDEHGIMHYRILCSGVWVSSHKILTAQHCVDKEEFIDYNAVGDTVRFLTWQDWRMLGGAKDMLETRTATVMFLDKKQDLALLEVKDDSAPHSVAGFDPQENVVTGMHVNVVGHPAGLPWSYASGVVAMAYRSAEEMDTHGAPSPLSVNIVQLSVPTWGGNSGGGAFDDDGNIIAICSYSPRRIPLMAFFIHHGEIALFLHQANL